MASRVALRPPASGAAAHPQQSASSIERPLLWAGFLTLMVSGPWLLPGYLFGTDWPGPRRFDFPTDVSSAAPLSAGLAFVGFLTGGEAAGKVFILLVLFMAALLAYVSLPTGGFVPRAAASTIYLVNPFVYGRLHYGQLFLLGAYAVLPWAASRFRLLLLEPGGASALLAATGFGLIGVFSPHVLLMAGLLAFAILLTHVLANRSLAHVKSLIRSLLLALGATVVFSAYWLVPFIAGRGLEANVIAGTGTGDLNAYAAVPDQSLGLIPNLLGLYGFWAENSGRFTSMKAFVPLWPAVLALMLLIATFGAAETFRQRSRNVSTWVGGLLIVAVLALLLEMGVSSPFSAETVRWIDAHFAFYRGLRDAGKWAVLLAFVYSQLVGIGAAEIQATLKKLAPDATRAEWIPGVAAGLLLALPLYYGNGLLFGAHGEIRPSQYPAGWYAADRVLAADSNPGRTLFLPWHEYMSYSFVHNQNRVVAPPAPSFFSVPIVVSSDPEVPGVLPPSSPDQDGITALVRASSSGQWAEVLNTHRVKYVLLAKELDWTYFKFLDNQAGLSKVGDFGSIILYRNDLSS